MAADSKHAEDLPYIKLRWTSSK